MFYNSEDDGQTNVEVEVLTYFTQPIDGVVIFGKDLIGSFVFKGMNYLIVHKETLTGNTLATITQLHR